MLLSPNAISFSKKDISIESLYAYSDYTTIIVTFADSPRHGDRFEIAFGGLDFLFWFSDNLDTNLPTATQLNIFNDMELYIEELEMRLQSHAIFQYFSIERQANMLTFRSREIIANGIEVTYPSDSSLPYSIELQAPTAVAPDAARVVVIANGAMLGTPLLAPYDNTYRAKFNIKSLFGLDIHIPNIYYFRPSNTVQSNPWVGEASRSFVRYHAVVQELIRQNAGFAVQKSEKTPSLLCVYGDGSAPDNSANPIIALRNFPILRKTITPTQPDFLFFLTKTAVNNAYVEIRVFFSNGGNAYWHPLGVGNRPLQFEAEKVYFIKTGFSQCSIINAQPFNRTITSYEFRLMSEANTLLASCAYQLDRLDTSEELILLLENPCGAVETLLLRGSKTKKYVSEFSTIEYSDGENETVGEEVAITYEVTTAYMETELVDYYRQLLRGKIWLLDKFFQPQRIVRISKEMTLNPNQPNNQLKFAFQLAKKI